MKRSLIALAAAALCAPPALAAEPIEGEWITEGGSARVHIAPCLAKPALMCGQMTWLKNALDKAGKPRLDVANPDPAMRQKPIVGMLMIRDFRRNGERWTNGKIYNPGSGKTYDAKMRVNRDGTLKLEGCVLVICEAQTWTRP